MPELPEVEAARCAISHHCIGKRITNAIIANDTKVIDGVSFPQFQTSILNKTIVAAHRKGKNLWIQLDSPPHPSFQFGMTGAVYIKGVAVTKYKRSAVNDADEWPSKFSKFFIGLDDGLELSFTDKRRFAKVRLLDDPAAVPPISELGPDALLEPMTEGELSQSLSKKKIAIKTLLLDQSFLSGIGNWVADEVLYQAGIHPMQIASSLSKADTAKLLKSINEVLEKAVEVGADSSQYPSSWIFHSREKKPGKAFVDGKKIDFITVGGRTTAFVPEIQKLSGVQAKKAPVKPRRQSSKKSNDDDDDDDNDSGSGDSGSEEEQSWSKKSKQSSKGGRKQPPRGKVSCAAADDDDDFADEDDGDGDEDLEETSRSRGGNRAPKKRKSQDQNAPQNKKSAAQRKSDVTDDLDGSDEDGDQGTPKRAEHENPQMDYGHTSGFSYLHSTQEESPILVDDEAPSPSSSPVQEDNAVPYAVPINASGSASSGLSELHPDELWFHHNVVVRGITSSIHSCYDAPYMSWKKTPQDAKEKWWGHFRTLFQWQPDLEERVRSEFDSKAALRLKDIVHKACKSDSWRRWMRPEVHNELMKIRSTPEFKKKSEQSAKNKLTGPKAGTKHSQGPVSTRELADRIYKETGEFLSASEMFLRTHLRADQTFVDERSKNIWDTYQKLKEDPEVQSENCTDEEIFLKAVGGWTKKGTLYGLGSSANIYYKKPSQSSLSAACSERYPNAVSRLEEELRATKEELQQQKQLYQEQQRLYEEHTEAIRYLREEVSRLSQIVDVSGGRFPSPYHS